VLADIPQSKKLSVNIYTERFRVASRCQSRVSINELKIKKKWIDEAMKHAFFSINFQPYINENISLKNAHFILLSPRNITSLKPVLNLQYMMGSVERTIPLGERLLPVRVDKLARDHPDKTCASIPKTQDLKDGYRDITYREIARAINRAAGWLEGHFGRNTTEFESLVYLGPFDIR
jgi:hypothetical protein